MATTSGESARGGKGRPANAETIDEASAFAAAVDAMAVEEGISDTALKGTVAVRKSVETEAQNRHWRACLAIVALGRKELVLGQTRHTLTSWRYTLTPFPLPLTSRITRVPFLCLLIGLDATTLTRVVADMDARDEPQTGPPQAFFTGHVSGQMRAAALRFAQLFASPEAAKVLGPGCVRELLFHVLQGPNGPAIRQFVRAGSDAQRIYRAVHRVEAQLSTPLDVGALAAEAGMSRTLFFEHFKRATSLSPVQFQKQLRLLEAQRLLMTEGVNAENATYRVGYQSPSQFSREYTRMFGQPPSKHLRRTAFRPGLYRSSISRSPT